jgi:hypothetical protein
MPESVADDTPCDLCGLPVKVAGVELKTAEGQKIFCCLGCKAIYSLYRMNDDEPSSSLNPDDSSNDLNQR